jgi:hypothetical protein
MTQAHKRNTIAFAGLGSKRKVAKLSAHISVLLLIASTLGLSIPANAQINLLHTFDGNYYYPSNPYYDNYYYPQSSLIQNNSYNYKSYNADFSLHTNKTINFTPPNGYTASSAGYLSELNYFWVSFINSGAQTNERHKTILYNENGAVLKDFGLSFTKSLSVHIANNQYRISCLKSSVNNDDDVVYTTEIYSAPGTPPSASEANAAHQITALPSPYPNPANAIITLPYKLEQGEFTVMNIYDIGGRLVEQKRIGYDFDKILLNVSNYTKGMYIYEVKGKTNKFVVE